MKARAPTTAWFSLLEELFIGLLLLAITGIIFLNVVLRYGFSYSWSWAEEFARYGIIWVTFVGGSVCVYRRMHIAVDLWSGRLNKTTERRSILAVHAVSVLFCVGFLWFSLQLTLKVMGLSQKTIALGLPMWIIYAAMPVGALLMAIRFAQQFLLTWHGEGLDTPSGNDPGAAP